MQIFYKWLKGIYESLHKDSGDRHTKKEGNLTTITPGKLDEKILNNCKKILAQDNSAESVLMFLKEKGYSKGWSIVILAELQSLDLDDAQKKVHFSETWSDVRGRDEQFHQSFVEAVEKEIEENDK